MKRFFTDEQEQDIIEVASEMGIKVPRSEHALRLAHATMMGHLCVSDLENPKEGEFHVNVCSNGCCVNMTCIEEIHYMASQMISSLYGEAKAQSYLMENAFQIIGLHGMS